MASSVNLSGAIRFDLESGAVRLTDDEKAVVVPVAVLADLVAAASSEVRKATGRKLGEHVGRGIARRAGSPTALLDGGLEQAASLLAAELALVGLGSCNLERWGRALVVHVVGAPAIAPELVASAIEGALAAATRRAVACTLLSDTDGIRVLVTSERRGRAHARLARPRGRLERGARAPPERRPNVSDRIGMLQALLARIQANTKKPRQADASTLTIPPSPDAHAALLQEREELPPPTKKPEETREVEVPLESRARLVAAPQVEVEVEEIDAEEVMELDDRHVVVQEVQVSVDVNAATQEQPGLEIEEPPPSSRRPIAEPAETPQEAELNVAAPRSLRRPSRASRWRPTLSRSMTTSPASARRRTSSSCQSRTSRFSSNRCEAPLCLRRWFRTSSKPRSKRPSPPTSPRGRRRVRSPRGWSPKSHARRDRWPRLTWPTFRAAWQCRHRRRSASCSI